MWTSHIGYTRTLYFTDEDVEAGFLRVVHTYRAIIYVREKRRSNIFTAGRLDKGGKYGTVSPHLPLPVQGVGGVRVGVTDVAPHLRHHGPRGQA